MNAFGIDIRRTGQVERERPRIRVTQVEGHSLIPNGTWLVLGTEYVWETLEFWCKRREENYARIQHLRQTDIFSWAFSWCEQFPNKPFPSEEEYRAVVEECGLRKR